MRRWPALLIAPLVLGLFLTAPVWRGPLGLAPATRFTDGHLLGAAVWGEALRRGELPSLLTNLLWPGPADFRPLLWPSALVEPIFGPALTISLMFALTPAFNALSGWVLARALGLGSSAAVILGAGLAAPAWVVETLLNGQVEQATIGGAALQLAAAIVALRRGGPLRIALAGLVTLGVGLAAPHVGLVGALLVGLWALDPRGEAPLRTRVLRMAGVIAAVAIATLAVHAYHSAAFRPGVHLFAPKGSAGRPTSLSDLPEVATLARLLFRPPASDAPVVHPNWLGTILPMVALVGAWRARTGRVAIVIGLVFTTLSLGPRIGSVPLPWSALVTLAPTVGTSLSAYRMVAGAVVALAVAAACAFEGRGGSPLPSEEGRRKPGPVVARYGWLICAPLLLLEGVVFASRSVPMSAQIVLDDDVELPASNGPVLDLPLAGPECEGGLGHYLLTATRNGHSVPLNLANARAGYAAVPGMVGDVIRSTSSKDCAARLGPALARWPFTLIVLHTHAGCPVPARMEGCLEELLGPGTREGEVLWWAR